MAARLDDQGFALASGIAAADEIKPLKTLFEKARMGRVERDGETYGARNLLALPEVREIAVSASLTARLLPLLGTGYHAVRGLFFDKTEAANWPVPWHQDLSLAVKERVDMPGWTGWSTKQGVPHVQAPAEILARMVTMRLHLDNCPAENGPLRVIAGSHKQGRLSRAAIQSLTAASHADTLVAAGRCGVHAATDPSRLVARQLTQPPTGAASGIRPRRIASVWAGMGAGLICCALCCSKIYGMIPNAAPYAAR